ncbi:hypothetical protein DPEC_G00300490 [Dallia pectoralis]|uniref:Uncharacterized protein n=1 Tax=Dallia pectoralis TaxID=75939 RepID=A0ACC2FGU0_DALPE|nr:hypothetical protein DPEC_G00300490 [Dallia pectoralis]
MKYTTDIEDGMEFPRFTFNPKEGIDNPAFISLDPENDPRPVPRLCQIKRKEEQSFGFRLRTEKNGRGLVVHQLDPWSPAELSGLREGDRVLEVNEDFVNNMAFSTVVTRIQACGLHLFLLVLKEEEYEEALSQGLDLQALTRACRGETCSRPRLCHISRDPVSGLGVSINTIEGQRGQYVLSTANEGPAERAGVRDRDRLVWINGSLVSTLTFSALNKMVKRSTGHVTILVIDSESEASYTRRKLPILPILAGSHNLPYRPKTLCLVQGSDGYGFLLRQERLQSGHIAHLLREVDAGSPAEQAGMQDGDLLLAVNGEPTESMEHEEIVRKVRKSGNSVNLTVIPVNGRHFYTQLGLPPLVFHEDRLPEVGIKSTLLPCAEIQNEQTKGKHGSLPCPRLCVLEREESGFGFHLGCVQEVPGTFIEQVETKGSGHRAGLWERDVVVEVNGQNVENYYFEDVVMLIKKSESFLKLLVVERSGYERLKHSGLPITPGIILHSNQVSGKGNDAFL